MDVVLSDFGWVKFLQPKEGYRFSSEPFVIVSTLPRFVSPKVVVDFGSGCGVIAILLCRCLPEGSTVYAVEINNGFVEVLRQNIEMNGVSSCAKIVGLGSIETNSVDLVVTNPPYFYAGAYRVSKRFYREKFERDSFKNALLAFRRILKTKGWLRFSYHPTRAVEAFLILDGIGFGVKCITPVYGSSGKNASYFLVDAQFGTHHHVVFREPIYLDKRDFTTLEMLPEVSP